MGASYLSAFRIVFSRTDLNRWKTVAKSAPTWDERNRLIASMVSPGSSVLDLGAGAQTLRWHLKDCKYQPCDVVSTTPDTLFCDFNNGIYPSVSAQFDYVICSGVLEYIRKPREFLIQCSLLGAKKIITYAPFLPSQSHIWRLNQGWFNHMKQSDLERLFDEVGFQWKLAAVWKEQAVYLVES